MPSSQVQLVLGFSESRQVVEVSHSHAFALGTQVGGISAPPVAQVLSTGAVHVVAAELQPQEPLLFMQSQ